MFPISVQFNNLEEADVAIKAVKAMRDGTPSLVKEKEGEQITAEAGLTEKLVKALSYPDKDGIKSSIIETLFGAPASEWVAYPTMVEAAAEQVQMTKEVSARRTPAALRDLSWQVKQKVDPTDLSGKQKPIEVLAERIRSGGEFSYRLTSVGRRAAEIWLHS
ncbi:MULTISPECIES: hypothetical protein [Rhizobium]|uniref:hypothetical protein n=1 Tax=Rhizobium TaxID=379 RepID=UPI0012FA57D8|nr:MULTISPECIES: hypothetical protein [Rhizobium]NNH57671.1 hypothetical protein [Rhizobium laguerreae]